MADDEESLGEQFLGANANVEYMAHKLADCLRNSMRAVAAGNPASASFRAVQDFDMVLKLLVRSKGVSLHDLFDKAIEEIRPKPFDPAVDEPLYRYRENRIRCAAQSAIQMVVERSCDDNAAHGRANRREAEFLNAVREIEDVRDQIRQQALAELKSAPSGAPRSKRQRAPRKK